MPASRIALVAAVLLLVALVGLYWYATGGFSVDHRTPDWLLSQPIAHRGLHTGNSYRPENSLAAFRAAARDGYSIELDVQITSDGTLVVMHDENLARMTGDPRDISSVTAAEVTRLRLLESSETVPTLGNVLETVQGRVPIFVEVKNSGAVGVLEDTVARQLKAARGPVAVMSFNPLSLARIAERAPEIPRGQLAGTFEGEDLSLLKKLVLSRMLMNWKSAPDFIGYDLRGMPSFSTWLQRKQGRPLIVWTAQTPEDYDRALQLGDEVVFELGATPD